MVVDVNFSSEIDNKNGNPIICLKNVAIAYSSTVALFDVDLDVYEGEMIALIGPNGSGKTSLLKSILGLARPFRGTIKVMNQIIDTNNDLPSELKMKIGYVPQYTKVDNHFPALVEDVVMMGRYAQIGLFKRPKKSDWEKVHDALKLVGMYSYRKRPIGHLSGGQLQKVIIARTLAQNPKILLLDEPTSSLDFKIARDIMNLIKRIHEDKKLTIIMVNHDLRLVEEYFPWVVCIQNKIVWEGSPKNEEFDNVLRKVFYKI